MGKELYIKSDIKMPSIEKKKQIDLQEELKRVKEENTKMQIESAHAKQEVLHCKEKYTLLLSNHDTAINTITFYETRWTEQKSSINKLSKIILIQAGMLLFFVTLLITILYEGELI